MMLLLLLILLLAIAWGVADYQLQARSEPEPPPVTAPTHLPAPPAAPLAAEPDAGDSPKPEANTAMGPGDAPAEQDKPAVPPVSERTLE